MAVLLIVFEVKKGADYSAVEAWAVIQLNLKEA